MDFIGAYQPDHLAFLLEGFAVTLKVAFISIILSFIIGLVVGTLRFAQIPVLSKVLAVVVETIRNLPLLLIIFFTYFALPEIGIKLSITASAIAALTCLNPRCCQKLFGAALNQLIRARLKQPDLLV